MPRARTGLILVGLLAVGCATTPAPAPPPPEVPQAPAPPPPDPRDFRATVHFGAGSAHLSSAAVHELELFVEKLRPFPGHSLHVLGFSEPSGIEADDTWLSERRAKSVAAFLVSRGIPADRVTLQGLGSETAVPGGPTGDRRVAQVSVR